MALKVKPLDKSAGGPALVKPGKRLFLTKDRKGLVEDGHPDAAILYCPNEDYMVPRAEYNALVGKKAKARKKE